MSIFAASRSVGATVGAALVMVAGLVAPPVAEASEVVKLTRIVIVGKRLPTNVPPSTTAVAGTSVVQGERAKDSSASGGRPPAPMRWFKVNPA